MTYRKGYIIIGAILLLAGVLVTGVIAGLNHAWPGEGKMLERFLGRMDSRVEELNLTQSQQTEYLRLRQRVKDQIEDGLAIRKHRWDEVKSELAKDKPDIRFLAGSFKNTADGIHSFVLANLDYFVEFYELLDEAQQAQVMAHFKKHLAKRSDSHGGHRFFHSREDYECRGSVQ